APGDRGGRDARTGGGTATRYPGARHARTRRPGDLVGTAGLCSVAGSVAAGPAPVRRLAAGRPVASGTLARTPIAPSAIARRAAAGRAPTTAVAAVSAAPTTGVGRAATTTAATRTAAGSGVATQRGPAIGLPGRPVPGSLHRDRDRRRPACRLRGAIR